MEICLVVIEYLLVRPEFIQAAFKNFVPPQPIITKLGRIDHVWDPYEPYP